MRRTRGALALVVALATGCGGKATSATSSVDHGTPPEHGDGGVGAPPPALDGGPHIDPAAGATAICDDLVKADSVSLCAGGGDTAVAGPACAERFRTTTAACSDVLTTYFRRAIEYAMACDPRSLAVLTNANTDYALCLSGGTCPIFDSAVENSASTDNPMSTYGHSKLCECTEATWKTSPGVCADYHDCGTVCCTCPGGGPMYTAAGCDLTSGTGVCMTAETVCPLFDWSFCDHSR
ncbi:MAG TPA: hypothetical protein VH062_30615 [Polyangiaceae bacterium]|nr:hypothetical protein [Polyangiaceae bacterium]